MDSEFFERVDKEREYKKYITQHIQWVEDNFHRLIEPLKTQYNMIDGLTTAVNDCCLSVPLHDLSKLSKDEFDGYRVYRYPTELEKKNEKANKEAYDAAKLHHVKNNPHHPYYWVNEDGTKQDMPLCYIFEMLCDWAAVSRHMAEEHGSKETIVDWYDNNATKEKAAFSDKTREQVDFWVDEIFRKPGVDR